VQSRRLDASPDRAREYVAAALESMKPVAAYAEDDGRVRVKTGSYGLATQGIELTVSVVGEDEGTTVTVSGQYVLFGNRSMAPDPERYVNSLMGHLDRAVAEDRMPTGANRRGSPDDLDGIVLPNGRAVPMGALVVAPLLFGLGAAALLGADSSSGEFGAMLGVGVAVVLAGLSLWRIRTLKRQIEASPASTAR